MKKLVILFISLCAIYLSSCSNNSTGTDPGNSNNNNSQPITYTVNVSVTPSNGGSVSPSSDTYDEGEEIELQANPNQEYVFTGWTGDLENSDNPLSLIVDQNYSLTANFELKSYELTVSTDGEGTVSEKVVEQKSKEYNSGTVVELTANPAEGYKFVEWTGDLTSTDNPVQVTVDKPKTVTAVFEKKHYPLTVNTDGEGAVSEQVVQQKTTDYKYGDVVELTANSAKGWKFKEWQGAITSGNNPAQITVDDTLEVTAVFEKKSYALNVSVTGEGSVTKSPDQTEYLYESTVDLEANPANGWHFVEWQGDVSSTNTPLSVSTDSTIEITAVFESSFAGGTGTETDPFKISTIEQLQRVDSVQTRGYHFVQINDIDASATANWNFNKGFDPILSFDGSYNGQGFAISNLFIDRDSGRMALFGSLSIYGLIENLRLVNIDISGGGGSAGLVGSNFGWIKNSSASGKLHCTLDTCGGLVGLNGNDSIRGIERSFADVDVTGVEDYIGGLVGYNRSSITYSYAIGDVAGLNDVGGLVGQNESGTIKKSYAQGQVTGKNQVGGLVGLSYSGGSISYCYATGKVSESTSSGTGNLGGLIGNLGPSDTIDRSYWDKENTGQSVAIGYGDSGGSNLVGLTTSEMTGSVAQTNMAEFDFVSVWQTVDGSYPVLFWQ